jgi:transposase-like protein
MPMRRPRAIDADAGQSWRRAWSEVIPFYAFPGEVRRILYTTKAMA